MVAASLARSIWTSRGRACLRALRSASATNASISAAPRASSAGPSSPVEAI
jgi:hypothetical protein